MPEPTTVPTVSDSPPAAAASETPTPPQRINTTPGGRELIATTQTIRLPHPLTLRSGRELRDVDIAYQTYGQLNETRDNVVVVCHALSGDAHAAGIDPATNARGWWYDFIGPGKAIDTDRYFVICSNCIGGCRGSTGPKSINPDTGKPYARDFPVITISDMVDAQVALLDALELTEPLLAVVGGSMGGMQVLDWAVRYPRRVRSAIPIATTARLNAQAIAFNAVGRNAIVTDEDYQDGCYYQDAGGSGIPPIDGLAIARMVAHITYLSEESMHRKFGRRLRKRESLAYDFNSEFSVETYLDHQGTKFVERFDANSYLYITKAMDYFDLAGLPPEQEKRLSDTQARQQMQRALADVLGAAESRFLVVSFSSDWLFDPEQSRRIVNALIARDKSVSYVELQSPYGHDAFLLESETLGRVIRGFLRRVETGSVGEVRSLTPQEAGESPSQKPTSPMGRFDYDTIVDLVQPGTRVLDIGSGNGELLAQLFRAKGVRGSGLELDEDEVVHSIERGITTRMGDADFGLPQYRDQQFDYVILSQTVQSVRRPDLLLREIVRVGRHAIVSFPNFGNWRIRLQLMLLGGSPRTSALPHEWWESPYIRFFSLGDFERFVGRIGARVEDRIPLVGWKRSRIHWWPNLRAEEAVYLITAK